MVVCPLKVYETIFDESTEGDSIEGGTSSYFQDYITGKLRKNLVIVGKLRHRIDIKMRRDKD